MNDTTLIDLARVDLAIAHAGSGTVEVRHGFTGSAFSSSSNTK